jgi:hypothetical protein
MNATGILLSDQIIVGRIILRHFGRFDKGVGGNGVSRESTVLRRVPHDGVPANRLILTF